MYADSATINPAALNSDLIEPAPRGIKRSRSPDDFGDAGPPGSAGDDGGDKPRKRGRPMKPRTSGGGPDAASATIPPLPPTPQTIPPQTPQSQNASLPAQTPTYAPPQASPPKSTPTKSTLKALPTVRDHTTDQLGPGGDEYLPREIDEAGEKKVMPNGMLTGNREYRCRTFLVPNRGDKLFMLATECARVLGYRDSYLLFNKNRSLYKIIASQVEKDDLVSQEILPFSYRSRQIAIVTARSMFRQFGSRVIVGGRRVRDDYWETKARKQGFTEADPAGEKRPGASKAREAETNHSASILGAPHGEIVYSTNPGQLGGAPQPQLMQPDFNDTRSRDYSGILKTGPRQEITGPPYQDRIQPSPISELHAQAHHAAEFNRSVSQQRDMRNDYMQSIWRRPHEQPTPTTLSQPVSSTEATVPTTRPGAASHSGTSGLQQPGLLPNQSPLMMTAAPYSQPIHAQNPIGQSSVSSRPTYPSSASSAGTLPQTTQNYSYVQSPMWPPTPQTPQHHGGYSAYTTAAAQSQPSPHPQQSPAGSGPQQHQQPQHQGQHPQQQQQHQSHQQQQQQQQRHSSVSSGGPVPPQAGGAGLSYSTMPGYAAAAAAAAQGMYNPADQTPRGYMHPNPQAAGAGTAGPAGGVNPQAAWSQAPQAGAGQWWGGQPQ